MRLGFQLEDQIRHTAPPVLGDASPGRTRLSLGYYTEEVPINFYSFIAAEAETINFNTLPSIRVFAKYRHGPGRSAQ